MRFQRFAHISGRGPVRVLKHSQSGPHDEDRRADPVDIVVHLTRQIIPNPDTILGLIGGDILDLEQHPDPQDWRAFLGVDASQAEAARRQIRSHAPESFGDRVGRVLHRPGGLRREIAGVDFAGLRGASPSARRTDGWTFIRVMLRWGWHHRCVTSMTSPSARRADGRRGPAALAVAVSAPTAGPSMARRR